MKKLLSRIGQPYRTYYSILEQLKGGTQFFTAAEVRGLMGFYQQILWINAGLAVTLLIMRLVALGW